MPRAPPQTDAPRAALRHEMRSDYAVFQRAAMRATAMTRTLNDAEKESRLIVYDAMSADASKCTQPRQARRVQRFAATSTLLPPLRGAAPTPPPRCRRRRQLMLAQMRRVSAASPRMRATICSFLMARRLRR